MADTLATLARLGVTFERTASVRDQGDLEEVLTDETARAGEATGEATAILSALPANVVNDMLRRIETLQRAVKFAREQANMTEVSPVKTGDAIFGYIFAPVKTS